MIESTCIIELDRIGTSISVAPLKVVMWVALTSFSLALGVVICGIITSITVIANSMVICGATYLYLYLMQWRILKLVYFSHTYH